MIHPIFRMNSEITNARIAGSTKQIKTTGDTGAREVIRRYPDRVMMLETADAEELHDIDHPEDLPGTSPAE